MKKGLFSYGFVLITLVIFVLVSCATVAENERTDSVSSISLELNNETETGDIGEVSCVYVPEKEEAEPVLSNSLEPDIEYKICDIGPAGGYIFYDCDADNDSGNADGLISTEVGWRYLEAAPADLRIVDGTPSVDASLSGYSAAAPCYCFGEYKLTDGGEILYVNGTNIYNASNCTGTAIGTGMNNTQMLVDAMGLDNSFGYHFVDGIEVNGQTDEYAARLCDILEYEKDGVVYDDWFLPSKDEVNVMFRNLVENGLGDFHNFYCTSSEYYRGVRAWYLDTTYYDRIVLPPRSHCSCVRPVRAF